MSKEAHWPKVSIIVPAKKVSGQLLECLKYCSETDYPNFEIIVLLDEEGRVDFPKTKVIVTGPFSPMVKRYIGAKNSTAEFLAFIDDDAFPSKGWLKNAIKNFKDERVVAVGGPSVTPAEDNILQKASGFIYSSLVVGGPYRYRYTPMKDACEVYDCPTCNFIIRRSTFLELEKNLSDIWPGEDTELCLLITGKLGNKIIYDPKVLVYHHRRELFIPHLKQIWRYVTTPYIITRRRGLTKILHLSPTIFLIYLLSIPIVSIFLGYVNPVIFIPLIVYLITVLISSVHSCVKLEAKAIPLVYIGTILTHITYGAGLIKYTLSGGWRRR